MIDSALLVIIVASTVVALAITLAVGHNPRRRYATARKRYHPRVPYNTDPLPDGDLTGWKAARQGLVKLHIPTDADRVKSTGGKCRAEYAHVMAIDTEPVVESRERTWASSWRDPNFVYREGETVYPDGFDDYPYKSCSHGIHFFDDRYDAITFGQSMVWE